MTRGLAVHEWEGSGYMPLVFSHDWQAAILNWEPVFELENVGEVERHNQSDEVFVLTKGQAVLFTVDDLGMQVQEMKIGVLYNVLKGVWHNLVSTRDASWIIIENRDTHLGDCELRQLSKTEMTTLKANLPVWAG
jgi:mannose-6-phosphate isomerase-like protein (cupin superfamily)